MYLLKFILIISLLSTSLFSLDYSDKPEVKKFMKNMNKKFNYKEAYLQKIFKNIRESPYIKPKPTTPSALKTTRSSEIIIKKIKKGPWDRYRAQNIEQNRTKLGALFIKKHHKTFKEVYKHYGVAPEYITAIIGIESYYGKNMGRYYVFDQLTHLAFDKGKSNKLYRYELQEFLRLCYREQLEPRAIKGSASGAIGLGQFLPSNYQKFAIDYNRDGKVRMSNADDAIASIANYFYQHKWMKNTPVAVRVSYKGNRFYELKTGTKYKYSRKSLIGIYPKVPFNYKEKVMLIKLERAKYDELWYGTDNFYVLTRYNHSSYYAMAVHQLAKKIKKEFDETSR